MDKVGEAGFVVRNDGVWDGDGEDCEGRVRGSAGVES